MCPLTQMLCHLESYPKFYLELDTNLCYFERMYVGGQAQTRVTHVWIRDDGKREGEKLILRIGGQSKCLQKKLRLRRARALSFFLFVK